MAKRDALKAADCLLALFGAEGTEDQQIGAILLAETFIRINAFLTPKDD